MPRTAADVQYRGGRIGQMLEQVLVQTWVRRAPFHRRVCVIGELIRNFAQASSPTAPR